MQAAPAPRVLQTVAFAGRHPETTGLYRVMQGHLGTFEQRWTDEGEGVTLPRFVREEMRGFLDCGIQRKIGVRTSVLRHMSDATSGGVRWAPGALPTFVGRFLGAPFPNRACTFRYAPGSP